MLQLNLEKLFSMQAELDSRIESEHGLKGEILFEKKMLALQVEVGELANETRCFKFWSLKPPAQREVILEEYVDGLHFILSIGIERGFRQPKIAAEYEEYGLVVSFLSVFERISEFWQDTSKTAFDGLLSEYFLLGKELGFSSEDIEQAYVSKNEVNHTRQDQGY